jgi:hypothetical protein
MSGASLRKAKPKGSQSDAEQESLGFARNSSGDGFKRNRVLWPKENIELRETFLRA